MIMEQRVWDYFGPEGEGTVAFAKSIVALDMNLIGQAGFLICSQHIQTIKLTPTNAGTPSSDAQSRCTP